MSRFRQHRQQPQHVQPQQQQQQYNDMREMFLEVTHPVSRQEPIFSKLEYMIRLSLNSVSASIYRLYSIKYADEIELFKHNHNHNYVDVWLNLNSERMREYPVEYIATQGFDINENGLLLTTGHISLERETMQDHTLNQSALDRSLIGVQKKKIFKLLHCMVAPGKCFFASSKQREVPLPANYDSIYFLPNSESDDPKNSRYNHKYLIFDNQRILASHIIFLEYDPEGDDKLRLISGARENNFFETNEKLINDAYAKAKLTVDGENENLESSFIEHDAYFDAARHHLDTIEARRTEICQNAERTEAFIRDLYRSAITRLNNITQDKLSSLLSEEAELRRRLEEIEWMNRFISYQKESVTPVNFLDSFQQHNSLKKDKITGMETVLDSINESMETVLPDIVVGGELHIESPTVVETAQEIRLVPVIDPDHRDVDDETERTETDDVGAGVYLDDEELLVKQQNEDCRIS